MLPVFGILKIRGVGEFGEEGKVEVVGGGVIAVTALGFVVVDVIEDGMEEGGSLRRGGGGGIGAEHGADLREDRGDGI